MEIFGSDLMIGGWIASNYGMVISSFDSGGNSDSEVGMSPQTNEQFISDNPVPVYLGQSYSSKLSPSVTLIKNPCNGEVGEFNEWDLRSMLRELTGYNGYRWMTIIPNDGELDVQWRVRITNVTYTRSNGKVIGVTLEMETDSYFAWSREKDIKISVTADKEFNVYNHSDDLNNYLLPLTTINCKAGGTVTLINKTDNNFSTEIKNVQESEILTIDSRHEIVKTSVAHDPILNDFNLHFIRMISGANTYTCNIDAEIEFKFREPRKIGFM